MFGPRSANWHLPGFHRYDDAIPGSDEEWEARVNDVLINMDLLALAFAVIKDDFSERFAAHLATFRPFENEPGFFGTLEASAASLFSALTSSTTGIISDEERFEKGVLAGIVLMLMHPWDAALHGAILRAIFTTVRGIRSSTGRRTTASTSV
mmetsp:Transcript_4012/g.10137  ORF Transcript_4012/g.10137 Transcript_4012/m.10137 type:complete len:152 (+) Transcript_4012:534-989(+)|eukprot:jgi/Tetstr1/446064/TSEL_033666.t1